LPRMSGIECTARLKEQLPNTQILILTAMDDQELVFMALEAGADGYLLKTHQADGFAGCAAGRAARRGADVESDRASGHESFRRKAKARDESIRLSLREEQFSCFFPKGIPTN